jgi:hypothetical protein
VATRIHVAISVRRLFVFQEQPDLCRYKQNLADFSVFAKNHGCRILSKRELPRWRPSDRRSRLRTPCALMYSRPTNCRLRWGLGDSDGYTNGSERAMPALCKGNRPNSDEGCQGICLPTVWSPRSHVSTVPTLDDCPSHRNLDICHLAVILAGNSQIHRVALSLFLLDMCLHLDVFDCPSPEARKVSEERRRGPSATGAFKISTVLV